VTFLKVIQPDCSYYECEHCGFKAADTSQFAGHNCVWVIPENQWDAIIDRLDTIIELLRNRL